MQISIYFSVWCFLVFGISSYVLGQEIHQEPLEIRNTDFKSPGGVWLFKLIPDDTKYRCKFVPGSSLLKLDLNVKQNDIVLSINGIALSDEINLQRAFRKRVKPETLELKILRDGNIINVSIPLK